MLKDHAHVFADRGNVGVFGCGVYAVDEDLAAGGRLQEIDAAQQGGLPEPDGPMMATTSPLAIFQRNILEYFQILKFFRDMFDLNH